MSAMIESRKASSPGRSFSSAIRRPSFRRRRLMRAWTRAARGSRRIASRAGRKNGSTRRSSFMISMAASWNRLRSIAPPPLVTSRPARAGLIVCRCGLAPQAASSGRERGDRIDEAPRRLAGPGGGPDRGRLRQRARRPRGLRPDRMGRPPSGAPRTGPAGSSARSTRSARVAGAAPAPPRPAAARGSTGPRTGRPGMPGAGRRGRAGAGVSSAGPARARRGAHRSRVPARRADPVQPLRQQRDVPPYVAGATAFPGRAIRVWPEMRLPPTIPHYKAVGGDGRAELHRRADPVAGRSPESATTSGTR